MAKGLVKLPQGDAVDEQAVLETIRGWAAIESPTSDAAAVNRMADAVVAAGEAIVLKPAAGAFTLTSSLPNTPSLELDLKAGQVHYVEYDLIVRSSRTKLELREVGEQVARVHIEELPELAI